MPPRANESFNMLQLGDSSSSLLSLKSCLSSKSINNNNNSSTTSIKSNNTENSNNSVQFRPRTKFLEVPNRDDYTKQQKACLWWNREELKLMRESANHKGESLRWAGDTFPEEEEEMDCTLGLITEAEEARQISIVRTMRTAVFLEQERQWTSDVNHPIRMAQKCLECTDQCKWEATDRGRRLANELFQKQNKDSSPSSSFKKKNKHSTDHLRCRSVVQGISPIPRVPKKKLQHQQPPLESVSAHEPRQRRNKGSTVSRSRHSKTTTGLDVASAHEQQGSFITSSGRGGGGGGRTNNTIHSPRVSSSQQQLLYSPQRSTTSSRKSLKGKVSIPPATLTTPTTTPTTRKHGRHAGVSVR